MTQTVALPLWLFVILLVLAAILNWPIDDRQIVRPAIQSV